MEKMSGQVEDYYWEVVEKQIGFGKRYVRPNPEIFPAKTEINAYLDEQLYANGVGLFITGAVGVGKTSILAHIAFRITKSMGYTHLPSMPERQDFWSSQAPANIGYISTSKLFDLFFKLGNGPHENSLRDLSKKPVLLLDDLGREYRSELPVSRFEEFIELRYGASLATIITTNLPPIELIKLPGLERVVDRFRDSKWMKLLTLMGNSIRK
jgi:DNA replication protein DnaC